MFKAKDKVVYVYTIQGETFAFADEEVYITWCNTIGKNIKHLMQRKVDLIRKGVKRLPNVSIICTI